MNTVRIQLNKKMAVLSAEHPYEFAIMRVFLFASALVVVAYLYLVSASALNVIARREIDQSAARLENSMGMLESRYFELSSAITPEKARAAGFSPLTAKSFVYRLETVGFGTIANNAI